MSDFRFDKADHQSLFPSKYLSVKILSKKIPYLFNFKNVFFISLFMGSFQVFITIFLEPHGTEDYQVPWRNLLLSGYILCFIFPFLMIYGIERWIYNSLNKTWKVYQEILSKTFLVILISTASYFYNSAVINSISFSFHGWAEHMIVFAWPYIPLFIPLMILVYIFLYWNYSPGEKKLLITGSNQDDILKITKSQFLYAESDQNYVTIYYKKGDIIEKKLMRSSLHAIEDQVDTSVRVHRSYLINPSHLKKIKGNKRKRNAILDGVDSPVPVSVNFDEKNIQIDLF